MNPESPEAAYIAWGGVLLINVFVLAYMFSFKGLAEAKSNKIIKAAAISTGVLHVILITIEGVSEIIMWIIVSFPFVFVVSIFINLALRAFVGFLVGNGKNNKL